ncbi:MAG: alanine racemase [Desulfobacterales bacterium]|nr:alanine racemase [Desulfobacterales bacterium]
MHSSPESQVIAHIDRDAIFGNIKALKKCVTPGVMLMAVAKSNGYGHGGPEVARKCFQAGADWVGVARFDEAMAIRKEGIEGPILIFGHTNPSRAEELARYNLTQTVYSESYALELSKQAKACGKTVSGHLKLDSGMGRLGILHESLSHEANPEKAARALKRMMALPSLVITGIYTHFASAEEPDNPYTKEQNDLFSQTLTALGELAPPAHATNGAALFFFPETQHQMVRIGSLVYGLVPPELQGIAPELTPAMTLKTTISQLKTIPKGFKLGYNNSWIAPRKSVIATIPLGYGDGFSRKFSNNGAFLVREKPAPIVGKVCMDMTMIDVTEIPGVQAGDEVVIFGFQGEAYAPARRLADAIGTNPEEILVGLTARVPRHYTDNQKAQHEKLAG